MAVATGELVTGPMYEAAIGPYRRALKESPSEEVENILRHDLNNYRLIKMWREDVPEAAEDPEERLAFLIPFVGALGASRDYIQSLYQGDSENERAALTALWAERVPLGSLVNNMNGALLKNNDGVFINGVECIVLYNLLRNAQVHGVPMMDRPVNTFSDLAYDQHNGQFTVYNYSPHGLPPHYEERKLHTGGRKGMFITHLYTSILGKSIEGVAVPTSSGNPGATHFISVNVQ